MNYASRDGVKIAYAEEGRGKPAVVLVHGWACNHRHLDPQFAHLSKRHRTIAVDLRGHGESEKPQQDYTIEGHANDLAWLCRGLDLPAVVIIGHSMGGQVALEFAASYPGQTAAMVALDSLLAVQPGQRDALVKLGEAMKSPGYKDILRDSISQAFHPADDSKRRASLIEDMLRTPQHVIAAEMRAIATHDINGATKRVKSPLLFIHAGNTTTDLAMLRELAPQAVVGATVGAGHWHNLEVPEQVNAMIDRFMAIEGLGIDPSRTQDRL
ncbi:MAG: alpha/beta hydrolase [Chloroflexi bacterium]|nr:alpha/beta hydrolase [Chloroflexota bacterium]